MIGRRLSHYDVVADLGAGGMGVVYRAHDTTLNRDVAIKVLPNDRAISENARARFKREALAASALNHPNIITIYEVNAEDGTDFIVMEFVRGSTLLSRLYKGKLSIEEALRYSVQAADALAKAHAAGIVHRDLKPGNIMITEDGLVKVLDFGLAKIDYEPSKDGSGSEMTQSFTLTQPGMVTGTVAYMSPEQARGEKVDARSDIFSFGIVMFEMLSGHLPFNGPNSIALLHNLHFSPPRDLTQLCPDVPPPIVALIARMLEKDPERRIQTMTEVSIVLRGGRGSMLDGPTTWMSRGSGVSRLLAGATPLPMAKARQRKTVLAIAGSVLVSGLLSSAAWRYFHKPPAPQTAVIQPELPADAYALYQRARLYLDMWDRTGNVDKAIDLLQQAVQVDPKSAVSYAGLAQAYCLKNRENPDPQWMKLAADNANKAVALDNDLAAAHLAQGLVREQNNDSQSAEVEYKHALQLDPKNSMAYVYLGRIYAKSGNADLAKEQFKLALQADPRNWEIYLEIGAQEYAAGQYKDAVAAWEQVLKLQPNEVMALVDLGAAYHALSRDDDAASKLQQALAIKPDANVYNNLGTIRYYQGHYADAARAFEKTVELSANDPNSWASLGDAYRQLNDQEKAKKAYQQAIQLVKDEIAKHPDQADLQANLALYLAKIGDKQGALQQVEPVMQAKVKDPTNLFEAAITYELCGKRNEALDALTAAVKAGQSLDDIKNEPELVSLRSDPRYHLNVLSAASTK